MYKVGGFTGHVSASYFSQEGHRLEEEIDRAKWLALRAQIQTNQQQYQRMHNGDKLCGVDLHGLTVAEALPYLIDSLNEWKHDIERYLRLKKKRMNDLGYTMGNSDTPTSQTYVNISSAETYDFNQSNTKAFSKIVANNSTGNSSAIVKQKVLKSSVVFKALPSNNTTSVPSSNYSSDSGGSNKDFSSPSTPSSSPNRNHKKINAEKKKSPVMVMSSPSIKSIKTNRASTTTISEILKSNSNNSMNHQHPVIRKKKYSKVFHIITGIGNHSNANIGVRLRPVILKYLRSHNYNFKEVNSGFIEVHI